MIVSGAFKFKEAGFFRPMKGAKGKTEATNCLAGSRNQGKEVQIIKRWSFWTPS